MPCNHHINFFPACRRWYPGRVSKRSVPDGLIDIRAGCSHAVWNVHPYTLTASGRVHLFRGSGSAVAMYLLSPGEACTAACQLSSDRMPLRHPSWLSMTTTPPLCR
ncbi:hypothetical protein D9J64_13265 [Escherichia coli]|nr:hypothetical protein [Escherichia coli]MDN0907935.1 hypothetical protein [Escherichia coli]MHV09464.1 hypothetical protein [Escherichia coli]MIC40320.1 hypothetical protein [Escherichia coli]HBY0199889.1 hypothetical protein [Klebsiella pneumoniae]